MRWTLRHDVTDDRIECWVMTATPDAYLQLSLFYHNDKDHISLHQVLDMPIDEWERAIGEAAEKIKNIQEGS